jgi:arginyl-tRNA--protein-N-Asp/Glu arginylyltransferase
MSATEETAQLYLSMPHPCGYLPDRMASTLFIDPHQPVSPVLFDELMRRGFRRSGDLIYTPHCAGCQACVPVRIPVAEFTPNRSQRRTWTRNRDLRVCEREPGFDPDQFALYRRYQAGRHQGSTMDDPDAAKYLDFLISRRATTRFFEFRGPDPADTAKDRLLCVAVVDVLGDGLSAVYTFFAPELSARGLGTYAVLWEIEHARRLGLTWLYLGYWIEESPKMAYKANFRPIQAYRNGRWEPLTRP